MEEPTLYPRMVKSVVAEGSRAHGPTLFFVFQVDASGRCEVHEQLACGGCSVWPVRYERCDQALNAIYLAEWNHFLHRPTHDYEPAGRSSLESQYPALTRTRFQVHERPRPVSFVSLAKPSPGPLRITVAEDHEWIRMILVEIVRQTFPAAEVIAFADGRQAFEAFRNGGCHFLVSNHWMPHMDGPTLIAQVRREASELPIVMVSTKIEDHAGAMAAGANWFLTKDQIMEHLPRLLRRYAGTAVKPNAADGR